MLDAPPTPLGPPETPPERGGGLGTFLPDLDHVTAGLAPGELWVVTGHPGSGKSILATQFALHWLFQHDVSVTMHSLRDPLFAVWTRLVAHTARVALSPARPPVDPDDATTDRLAEARRRLSESRPNISTSPAVTGGMPWDPESLPKDTRLLVVDDAQHCTDRQLLPKLSQWARHSGASVLLTVPTADLYAPHPHAPHGVSINEPWREYVHLAAEIRWTAQDPDFDDFHLELLYHRWGPVSSIEMYFEPFYGRFRPVRT